MVTNKGPVIKSYLEIYFKTGQLTRSFPKYNHYITNLSIPDYFLFSNYLKTFSASCRCRYMKEIIYIFKSENTNRHFSAPTVVLHFFVNIFISASLLH